MNASSPASSSMASRRKSLAFASLPRRRSSAVHRSFVLNGLDLALEDDADQVIKFGSDDDFQDSRGALLFSEEMPPSPKLNRSDLRTALNASYTNRRSSSCGWRSFVLNGLDLSVPEEEVQFEEESQDYESENEDFRSSLNIANWKQKDVITENEDFVVFDSTAIHKDDDHILEYDSFDKTVLDASDAHNKEDRDRIFEFSGSGGNVPVLSPSVRSGADVGFKQPPIPVRVVSTSHSSLEASNENSTDEEEGATSKGEKDGTVGWLETISVNSKKDIENCEVEPKDEKRPGRVASLFAGKRRKEDEAVQQKSKGVRPGDQAPTNVDEGAATSPSSLEASNENSTDEEEGATSDGEKDGTFGWLETISVNSKKDIENCEVEPKDPADVDEGVESSIQEVGERKIEDAKKYQKLISILVIAVCLFLIMDSILIVLVVLK
jgi:hypothetical protein